MQTIDIFTVISALDTEAMQAFAFTGIVTLIAILVLLGLVLLADKVITMLKAKSYEEEVIECVGLESISAEEWIDSEDAEFMRLDTTHAEIHDNVVYLDAAYKPRQDAQVMEQDGVSLKDRVEMAIWSARRTFHSMVKFVKDLAAAPARVAKLEARIAELESKQFDFDFYSAEDDIIIPDRMNG